MDWELGHRTGRRADNVIETIPGGSKRNATTINEEGELRLVSWSWESARLC